MKRLLLLSATSGNGHVAAAEAVAAALATERDDIEVHHADLLDLVARPLRFLGRQGYMACVTYWPGLWRAVYHISDGGGPMQIGPVVTDVLAGGLMRLVRTWAPDRILSTYWAPAALKRWIPRSAGRRVPLSTVITDADLHVAWFQPDVDVYYVSDDSIRDRLVARGFPGERVVVSGIPAHPRFRPAAAGDAREALGLRPDRRWILLVAGPRSMRPLALRARDLIDATPGIGFLVLAGRDESLLRRLAERPHPDLVVAGMVPDLERWIAASDLVVAKGGGLITAETTAVGRPLLIHRPIPGQEEANAVRLERAGAARVIRDADHLRRLVGRLFGSEGDGVVERMARASGRLGRPEAARTIAQEEARRLDGLPS